MQFGSEAPKGFSFDDKSPGTGPYAAAYFTDDSLPDHTIFAPKSPPKGVKLPALIWGNGGCGNVGTSFGNLHREIASHGFIVVANGPPAAEGKGKGFGGQSKMKSMTDSLDWLEKGAAAGKFGEVDASKIAAAGQSCGGLEAYSASYHDARVKATLIMNSGVIDPDKKYLLNELKAPVALIIGGPKDIAYLNAESDWDKFPKTLPVVKANLDTGHGGTYSAPNAGKFGKLALAFLKMVLKNDPEAKKQFLEPAEFIKENWNITTKNFN